MSTENGGIIVTRDNRRTLEESMFQRHFAHHKSHANPTWAEPRASSGVGGEMMASNILRPDTTVQIMKLFCVIVP
jgi:hypothetical protein